jgi:hypothetical protein
MKNLKFLFASVICLTSLLFTSCMDTNDTSHTYGIILATVTNTGSSIYFTDANNVVYIPTNSSSLVTSSGTTVSYTNGDIAYVSFYYASETQVANKTGNYSIVLQGYADIQKNSVNVVTTAGATNDTLKTDSVISVDGVAVVGSSLVATTNFYLSGTTQSTSLFYYQSDGFVAASASSVPDTLKFILSHNRNSDEGTYYTTKDYAIAYYYNAFNISTPMTIAGDQSSKDSIVVDLKARVWTSTNDDTGTWKHFYCTYAKNNY